MTASTIEQARGQLTWVSGLEKQRKKRFSSKVKTGCETCKKRRVKCDEGKPACTNCTRSGRRCEGYQSANLGIYWFEHDGKGKKAGNGPWIVKHIDPIYGNEGDKTLLDLFMNKAATQVVRYSHPYFWYTLVPQASWSHEGIRHGVAAVGLACHELKSPETRAVSRQARSVHHYNAAIRSLTKSNGETTPADVMLICCVLFWLFENVKNRPCIAMTHLKAAVNMLNERPRPSANREDLVSTYIEPVLQEGMVFAATVLPTGGRRRHEAPATMAAFVSVIEKLKPSEHPKDLHESRHDFGRCQEALVIAKKMEMSGSSPDPDMAVVRKLYSDWKRILEGNASKWHHEYVRMLRMHYGSQMLSVDIVDGGIKGLDVRHSPDWRPRIRWILDEARHFVLRKEREAYDCTLEPLLNISLIALLSTAARQCPPRDDDLANEAIDLLLQHEWFEGIWNSHVAGELVKLMRSTDKENRYCRSGDLMAVFETAAGIKEDIPTKEKQSKITPAPDRTDGCS